MVSYDYYLMAVPRAVSIHALTLNLSLGFRLSSRKSRVTTTDFAGSVVTRSDGE
jgi:hypothetical protein